MPPDHGGAREVAGGCGVVLAEVVSVGAAVRLRPPALPQPQLRTGVEQEEGCKDGIRWNMVIHGTYLQSHQLYVLDYSQQC